MNKEIDLHSRGDLQKALRAALKAPLKNMTLAINRTYGPDALGYEEPKRFGDTTEPPEFLDQFTLRMVWFHSVLPPFSYYLKLLNHPDHKAENYLRELLCAIRDRDLDSPGTWPDLSEDVKNEMRDSIQQSLDLIECYTDLHSDAPDV